MMETGLTQYWRTKYWPRKNRSTDDNNNSHKIKSLNFSDLKSVFLVFAIGVTLATATFLIELIVFRFL